MRPDRALDRCADAGKQGRQGGAERHEDGDQHEAQDACNDPVFQSGHGFAVGAQVFVPVNSVDQRNLLVIACEYFGIFAQRFRYDQAYWA